MQVDRETILFLILAMIAFAWLVMELTTVELTGTVKSKMLGPQMEPIIQIDDEFFVCYWTAYNRVNVGQKVKFKASIHKLGYLFDIKQIGSRFARDVFPIE